VITARFELPAAMPCKISGWVIVTCSGYVPGQTRIFEPAGTPATDAEMVVKFT
jgi:hypothetical protein